jgi:hypothetical protein
MVPKSEANGRTSTRADIRKFTVLACDGKFGDDSAYQGGYTVDYSAGDPDAEKVDGQYTNAAYTTFTVDTCAGAH